MPRALPSSMASLTVERGLTSAAARIASAPSGVVICLQKGLLYIEAPGTALQVCVGDLSIRLADGTQHLFPPGTHRLRTIILAGRGNSVTSNAVAWLVAERVELLISENASQFIALFASSPHADTSRAAIKLRLRQFEAVLNPSRSVRIAREIVARKIKAECHPRAVHTGFTEALGKARSTDDIRHVEAGSAQIWWNQ